MMFLIICSQAILVPQNMLQRIDRHVSMLLPKFSFLYVASMVYRHSRWYCGHSVPYTDVFRGY